jgi:hypothetical protein
VIINEEIKYKVKVMALSIALIMGTSNYAVGAESTDTSTVTTTVVDPLDQYRGATSLTEAELVDLLSKVGFEGKSLKLAWSVVMRESRGHPLSHNTSKYSGDNSYGLFQINMLGSLGIDRREKFGIKNNAELLDPVKNAQVAFYMTAHGTDFGSWGLGPNAYDGTTAEPEVTIWLSKFPK